MPEVPARQPLQFTSFELNLQTGELRKAGVLVGLPAQSLKVLVELLCCSGPEIWSPASSCANGSGRTLRPSTVREWMRGLGIPRHWLFSRPCCQESGFWQATEVADRSPSAGERNVWKAGNGAEAVIRAMTTTGLA